LPKFCVFYYFSIRTKNQILRILMLIMNILKILFGQSLLNDILLWKS